MLPSLERFRGERSDLKRFNVKGRLTLVLTLYLVLATIYSVITPIGRGADEWAHYWYAQFIAQHGRLPLNPTERKTAGYKSDWPPLYHLSAAAVTAWVDTAGPPTFKYRADPSHIRRQIIPAPTFEAILHTEDELFPWQQEILVWHLGRFLSIAFSLGTLLVTYKLALEVFSSGRGAGEQVSRLPSPQTLAVICVAFLAFIPRFLFTGMLFNYDSLTLLLASLFLWLAVRVAKGYYPRWSFWVLGGLAGLVLLTKYLAALLPLEIVLLAFSRGAEVQSLWEASPGDKGERINSPLRPRSSAPLLKLGQALLAFILVTSGWFGYLLVNFNEIETYGPVLGTVAPLLRGDGSDRTVEQIFAALSGGQAPPPAHIDQQHYSAWQLISEFFITFWSNPATRPSPLNWFVGLMTLIALVAIIGLIIWWRTIPAASLSRRLVSLLLLHCLLALPFMLVRLFGARDALEAVQGRHVLFLAGPAIAILLVWGLSYITYHASRITSYVSHFTFQAWLGLLLIGALSQLFSLWLGYPPLLPVRTTANTAEAAPSASLTLPGGAIVVGATVTPADQSGWGASLVSTPSPTALQVTILWRGGSEPTPEDYQMELALLDAQGETRASWLAYQTQAHYPTRVWEPGDTIQDEGWLPLLGLAAGEYQVRWRVMGEAGEIIPWQSLPTYTLDEPTQFSAGDGWILWQQGQIIRHTLTLSERETAQFTFPADKDTAARQLVGPDGLAHSPVSAGEYWANFLIGPDWPAGAYRWQAGDEVVLRVAANDRNFQRPAITHPLEVNFAGQVKLLGYDLPTRRVQPGEGLPVTLYWQGLRWMGEDFVIFERLLDNQGMAWGGYDRRAKENYSTLLWAPGEIVIDGFAVPVDAAAPPGVYNLSLGWYRRVGEQADSLAILKPETGEPSDSTAVTIGPIKVGGPPPGVTVATVTPQTEVNVTLGEQIKLLGFDLAGQPVSQPTTGEASADPLLLQSSKPLHLTLYWQALTAPAIDYTVFAHLRNAAGETVAQKDSPPTGGAYPTSLWDANEIIKDEITISLENVTPGRYDLVVGMYDFQTGLRLAVPGNPNSEIVLTKTIRVDSP